MMMNVDGRKKRRRVIAWMMLIIGWGFILTDLLILRNSAEPLTARLQSSGYQALCYSFLGIALACNMIALVLFFTVLFTGSGETDHAEQNSAGSIVMAPMRIPLDVYNRLDVIRMDNNIYHTENALAADVYKWSCDILAQLDDIRELERTLDEKLKLNSTSELDEASDLMRAIKDDIFMVNTKKLVDYYTKGGRSAFSEYSGRAFHNNLTSLALAKKLLNVVDDYIKGNKTLGEVKEMITTIANDKETPRL